MSPESARDISWKDAPDPQEPPKKLDKVRIGIVGGDFGTSFQWHLDPDCEVVAVCDLRSETLDKLKSAYRCDTGYQSYREMLAHPGMNAVAVFTPAPLHAPMAIEAMQAGKHVISAVPAGMSVEELEQLLDCVKATGMKYMMAETSYYRSEVIRCREMAQRGEFGTIFYSEAEYHHEGLLSIFWDKDGNRTWRYGFPPMHYITHSTGLIIPVINERLAEVQAIGWGDGHESLRDNRYGNPFWNTQAFFKTSGGHASRISVCWHIAAGSTERGLFYGDRASYIMERPEGSRNTIIRLAAPGDAPNSEPVSAQDDTPTYFERLPRPMRVECGHGNSHTFLTHEFVRAIVEDRQPTVNIYEAIAYTLPGIIAQQSALKNGEVLKIRDYGKA